MFEVATTESARIAFDEARRERSRAFTAFARRLVQPFRALARGNWPQVGTRRWSVSPQGCPAGQ